jgi:hypothetical protein
MPCGVDSSTFAALVDQPADARYGMCLAMLTAADEVWILTRDGEAVMMVDDGGIPCLPIWPHRTFARVTADADGRDGESTAIDLELFIDRWLPRMAADGLRIAVFPTPQATGLAVHPAKLAADLAGC